MCPLECPMSILLTCPSVLYQLYADPARVNALQSVQGKTSALNNATGGEDGIMFEAYNIVLEHFFFYDVPYIVYNPKLFQVKTQIFVHFSWFVNGMDTYISNQSVLFCHI